jgi:hypothetical protein
MEAGRAEQGAVQAGFDGRSGGQAGLEAEIAAVDLIQVNFSAEIMRGGAFGSRAQRQFRYKPAKRARGRRY